jgi:RimJ/RimL family protein N-acetyltransferase
MDLSSIILTGRLVRLEPLTEAHTPDLALAGQDASIWQFMPYGPVVTPERMAAHVRKAIAHRTAKTEYPFAVIYLPSGRAVGCTCYLDIQPHNHTLEIGGTWYDSAHQRTRVNTECKFLLLRHAFEHLACLRVQFKTDLRNERSQRALERIGAIKEGVLRKNITMPDGYQRSSVVYGIVNEEWHAVKMRLERLLSRP